MSEITHEERTAMALAERLKKDPALLRPYLAPPLGSKKATPRDERAMFWQRNPTETLDDLLAEFARMGEEQGVDPQEAVDLALNTDRVRNSIAARLYPMRLAIVRAGERRFSPKAQIEFTKRMIRLGPPEDPMSPKTDATDMEEPAPEMPDSMDMSAEPMTPVTETVSQPDVPTPDVPDGGLTDAPNL